MKEFKINNFLTLKLEDNRSIIYVAGEKFEQCKSLFLTISINEMKSLDEIESIDEMSDRLDNLTESNEHKKIQIPPKVEFWGHCSNLQVWSENNYNTRLIHSNLAFPLLKKLTDVGDPIAKRIFKDEIAKRLEDGNLTTIGYLSVEGFLSYLSREEFSLIFNILKRKFDMEDFIGKIIETGVDRHTDFGKSYFLEKIQETMPEYFKNLIKDLLGKAPAPVMKYLIDSVYIKCLSKYEFWLSLINTEELIVIRELERELEKKIDLYGEIIHTEFALRAFVVEKKRVTGLALEVCGLENVPELIKNLKNLKILDLEGNFLKNISGLIKIIKNMKELEVLKLNENKIEKLPKSIDELKSLKVLNLSDNNLTDLPDSFENLKCLEILDLSDNRFRFIPEPVYKLSSLKELNIQSNRFVPNIKLIKRKMRNKDLKIFK